MNKLKAAVIGCGGAGMINHIPWYACHEQVELVGLVDTNLSLGERCSKRWGGRAYASLCQMLEAEQPDVVSIATPVHLHARQAIQALEAGCHVLCEKPMARTLGECQQMIDRAEKKGLLLGVALDKRHSPVFQRADQLLRSGEIGEPRFIRVHWTVSMDWGKDSFRSQRYTGGGVFQDVGSHFVDLCIWLMGSEIRTVQGAIQLLEPEKREVEDHAVAMLAFDNGMTGLIETSWVGPRDPRFPHLEEVWVYGSEGALKALGAARLELPGIEVYDRKTNSWRTEVGGSNAATFEHYQYKRMIDEFVRCVQEGEPFVTAGTEGRRCTEVVLAVYQSWLTDRKVTLPLREEPCLDEVFTRLHEEALARSSPSQSTPVTRDLERS